jgi:hypothetical protein
MATAPSEITRRTHPQKAGSSRGRAVAVAALVLCIAIALARLIYVIQAPLRLRPERAVSIIAVLFAAILILVPGAYILRAGRKSSPATAGLLFLSACSVLLLSIYFFQVSWYVFFPADIWIWSEGDFINDILKFSTGYPLYTPAVNLDSTHYPPGPQLLTYMLAWVAGKAWSIPAYRVIQVVYTALASFVAMLCCRRILRMAMPGSPKREGWIWIGFWYAALFLMATNSITDRFAHNLHGDALAQLATMVSFYLLLVYIDTRSRLILWAMILLVPAEFFVKQNLLIWAVFYGGFLALWGRSLKRFVVYVAATALLFGAALAVCRAVWGAPFFFWIFTELSRHAVSPLRGFQHLLDSWAYFAAGLLGGAAILRGRKPELLGCWLIWLALIVSETYTSGIEWMLNHIGPGCLMAGIWFLAGLAAVWDQATESSKPASPERWIRVAAFSATVALLFSGMGLVRIPLQPVSDDLYRYVHDIEKEFEGQPANRVLLDAGTWVYMKDRVVMGDRGPATGMLGMADFGQGFSGILSRIAARRYSKILVRDLHEHNFEYENDLWPTQSGIRQALLDNYREVGNIRAAVGPKEVKNWAEDPYFFNEITILEPKDGPPYPPRE